MNSTSRADNMARPNTLYIDTLIPETPIQTKSTICLSCFAVTDFFDKNTPFCVLLEAARIHKIDIQISDLVGETSIMYLVRQLSNTASNQPLVTLPLSNPNHRSSVAHFLNPYVSWPDHELKDAFSTFCIYMWNTPLPERDFTYGYPTPGDTNRLSVLILYKLCKVNDLPLRTYHTIDNLASAVSMLVQDIQTNRYYLYQRIIHVKEEALPILYLTTCKIVDTSSDLDTGSDNSVDNENTEVTINEDLYNYYEDITQSIKTLNSDTQVFLRIKPLTQGEAIYLAAINFELDISSSIDVIKEYDNLLKHKIAETMWVPLDPIMRDLLCHNPVSFNLYLYFNPKLPAELYDKQKLKQLAIEEGYTTQDLRQESAYSLLSTAFLSQTFYHGLFSAIINDKTPIEWDSISEIPRDHLVCFGVKTMGLMAFKYSELADDFSQKKNFTNPLDREGQNFPAIAITKLKKLCQKTHIGETEGGMIERQRLFQAITLTELYTDESNDKARELHVTYTEGDEEIQIKISTAINALLHLSMCCRGWLNDSDMYPVDIAPVGNQYLVDVRVTQSIATFENTCTECGEEISTIILNLPLLRFQGGWQTSNDVTIGLTIGERLMILKTGTDRVNSCMRVTSNYFAGSAYRYLEVLGFPPPFDITRLKSIS